MKVLDKLSHPGSEINYDRVDCNESCCWVMDGAKAPLESNLAFDPNMWLVTEFSKALAQVTGCSNQSKLIACLNYIDEKYAVNMQKVKALSHVQQPSFALAMLSHAENTLECSVIADCSIVVMNKSGDIQVFSDLRVAKFSNLTKNKNSNDSKLAQIIANRDYLNKVGGYWACTSRTEWIKELQSYIFDANTIERVLLCSDGFARAIEFKLYSWADLLTQKVTLAAATKVLRAYESRTESKEVKCHDDASAVLVAID